MGGGSMGIRAAARAAFISGYRSASNARRSALPSSSSAAAADTRPASTATTFDDWYIPDREVFGPVPSHEEAMAATLDLRDAFEMCAALNFPNYLALMIPQRLLRKHFRIISIQKHLSMKSSMTVYPLPLDPPLHVLLKPSPCYTRVLKLRMLLLRLLLIRMSGKL
uniref:Uncharacterized protein n=1 Tax=Aegilops tauschii subsp. strangulata TaxID=200361 RepID=A0A453IQH0_AEGTS